MTKKIELNSKLARTWSRLGIRAVYGISVSHFANEQDNVIALSADLGRSSGLLRFANDCPQRFINTGIAEQNMVGVAAGLAREGFCAFASSFAPFASLRASEQVRMNMGYMREPVKLVGLGSGLAMGFLGNSHYGLDDLAFMQSVPDLTIISPADGFEVFKTIENCVNYEHPVYIRLTGAVNYPIVYTEDYDFRIGEAIWLRKAGNITLIASGGSVAQCLHAANLLQDEGIEVSVLNHHTIKPLDNEKIAEATKMSDAIFVVEEHMQNSGLGVNILRYLNETQSFRGDIILHGLPDQYLPTGDYDFLLNHTQLDAQGIYQRIMSFLGQ